MNASWISQLSWTDIRTNYFRLVDTIVPGPQSLSYLVPHILLPASLLIPPELVSHHVLAAISLPIILGSTIHAWTVMRGIDVISADTLWWSFFFLASRDPRMDFRRLVQAHRKGTDSSPKVSEESYPKGFLPRSQWVFALLRNRPLTSWKIGQTSYEAAAAPPYVNRSRAAFIKSILIVLLPALVVFMPLSLQLKEHDSFFAVPGRSIFLPRDSTPAERVPIMVRVFYGTVPRMILRPLTLGMYLYSLMILGFLPPYLIPVLATFITNSPSAHWSPHTWPRPHFGPFSAVLDSGLRGLWGRWWHQQMRHAVSEPGRWLASKLRLKKGSLVRYAVICTSAFTLSGITHTGLVPPEPKWATVCRPWELRVMVAAFFWVQPMGILLEVTVVEPAIRHLAKQFPGSCTLQRCLRLVWVLLFTSFALTFLSDPFIELGYWKLWPPVFLPGTLRDTLQGNRIM